jgi:hypothetical protein
MIEARAVPQCPQDVAMNGVEMKDLIDERPTRPVSGVTGLVQQG